MVLLTITVQCSSIHNCKIIFSLHHVEVMQSKCSQGYSSFFLFKNKLEGSPWWSVLSCWECLSLVLRTHLLGIFTPHLLYCLQKWKCRLISCADGMKQQWEVDQGTDTALGSCRGKTSLIHLTVKPQKWLLRYTWNSKAEQHSETWHMGKNKKTVLLILTQWEARLWKRVVKNSPNPPKSFKWREVSTAVSGPAVKREDIYQVHTPVSHITSFQNPPWHLVGLLVKPWTSHITENL